MSKSAAALAALLWTAAVAAPDARASFVNFESGQVRPLAMSPDGSRLFAVNTPDNRLEIFDVDGSGLTPAGSVPVGMEPVAVAARNASEVWVVNHLSDSISIVDVASTPPRVVRTLLTCDEPRDIVFAGPGGDRAFVATARRGQNCAVSADPTTRGIGRAIVQVYNANSLGNGLAGNTLANIELFGDTPRALARSADGNTVYAAIFHSGNQTTAINEAFVCDGGASAPACTLSGANVPGGLPAPNANVEGITGPEVGLIVKFDPLQAKWVDPLGRDWSEAVRFDLPDLDVFAIDAAATPPVQTASFPHVGTVLFNVATNPTSGKVYVSNTEARNEVRFEGPGLAFGSTTVQGRLHEARISVIDGGNVVARHLNKHIDYDQRPAPVGVAENSLATPLGMAVTGDGETLYVAAFGSSKIGVFDTAALESDSFVPSSASHIEVSGGGPTGIVLDEPRGRLYALTRFDNSISIVDLGTASEIGHVAVYTPEPQGVVEGRPVLYDAASTSSNGEASCSSCHVFGDLDSLAWDLGNPDDEVLNNPIPFRIGPINIDEDFHPLKGPMTTQSLRGMANHGSMHWRGDRTGGNDPGGSPFDEDAAFKKFNVAFPGLLGRTAEIPDADMQAFTDFILSVTYPPNPIRNLQNTLSSAEQAGRDLYFGRRTDILFNCNGCHTLDAASGFFGSDGFATFEGETQMFKVAHLRNAYQKIGMFGVPPNPHRGPQIRGYGFLHDGSIDTVSRFLSASVFQLSSTEENQLQRFVLAFDSNFAPVVGQQVTLRNGSPPNGVTNRINLLLARAGAGECEVVAKATIAGEHRGAHLTPEGTFRLDRVSDSPLADAALRALAATAGQEITYTCVPPGSGQRMGIDRDSDGFYDRDELDTGSDPANASSIPPGATPIPLPTATPAPPVTIRSTTFTLRDDATPPIRPEASRLVFRSSSHGGDPSGVVIPVVGSASDPTADGSTGGGATLTLYRTDGTQVVSIPLDVSRWQRFGNTERPGYKYSDPRRESGPITFVSVKNGTVTVRGQGAGMYQLDDAPQGTMALRLRLGTGREMCTSVAPKFPAGEHDNTVKFIGVSHSAAPFFCPPLP